MAHEQKFGEWWFELAFAIADAAATGDTETLHSISEQLDEIVEAMPEDAATLGALPGDLRTLHFLAGAIAASYARRRDTAF